MARGPRSHFEKPNKSGVLYGKKCLEQCRHLALCKKWVFALRCLIGRHHCSIQASGQIPPTDSHWISKSRILCIKKRRRQVHAGALEVPCRSSLSSDLNLLLRSREVLLEAGILVQPNRPRIFAEHQLQWDLFGRIKWTPKRRVHKSRRR